MLVKTLGGGLALAYVNVDAVMDRAAALFVERRAKGAFPRETPLQLTSTVYGRCVVWGDVTGIKGRG